MIKWLSNLKSYFKLDNLNTAQQISVIAGVVISLVSLLYSVHSNNSQNKQWEETFSAQKEKISLMQSAIDEINVQNQILNNSLTELDEQNEILSNSLNELSKQNEIIAISNEVLQNSLKELEKQNVINETNLDLLLSEKGVLCKISYLCCWYDGLKLLLDDLNTNKLLKVNNNLVEILDLEQSLKAEPYKYTDVYLDFVKEFGGVNSPVIVLLKIDLTSNNTVLTQNITLNMSEVNFSENLPFALTKFSMYTMSVGLDYSENPVQLSQYNSVQENITYQFDDQLINAKQITTILCPVMVCVATDDSNNSNGNMLASCSKTYKNIYIPNSITFTDSYSNKTITKSIRDLNDYGAITEYRTVIGYG